MEWHVDASIGGSKLEVVGSQRMELVCAGGWGTVDWEVCCRTPGGGLGAGEIEGLSAGGRGMEGWGAGGGPKG